MQVKAVFTAGAALVLSAGIAAAEPKMYPVHTGANYCPEGLQPVTMDGTICCERPNQTRSYQSMMAHPTKRKGHRMASMTDCPVGEKGCR